MAKKMKESKEISGFGLWLRAALEEKPRITNRVLGDCLGISEEQVSKWLNGHAEPGPTTRQAVREAIASLRSEQRELEATGRAPRRAKVIGEVLRLKYRLKAVEANTSEEILALKARIKELESA